MKKGPRLYAFNNTNGALGCSLSLNDCIIPGVRCILSVLSQ